MRRRLEQQSHIAKAHPFPSLWCHQDVSLGGISIIKVWGLICRLLSVSEKCIFQLVRRITLTIIPLVPSCQDASEILSKDNPRHTS